MPLAPSEVRAMTPTSGVEAALRVDSPFRFATYCVAIAGLASAALAFVLDPILALFTAAILCGWSEVDGLCGSSHVIALTPLRSLDRSHKLWRRAVFAYTVGGIGTAACIGAAIGAVGQTIGLPARYVAMMLLGLAVALVARELRWVNFHLPQVRRQTEPRWAFQFGFVPAAAMWGAHIGIGFVTVIAHGGFFVLVGFCTVLKPSLSAMLMATYWVGRTLPVWVTPLLTRSEDAGKLGALVIARSEAYRHIAALGIALFGAAAIAGLSS